MANWDNRRPARATVGAVVTAGGSGSRFGGFKQFAELDGRSVLARAVDRLVAFADVVVVPLPEGQEGAARATLSDHPAVRLVRGGATRALSVLAGLQALPPVEWVLVHDAARPRASEALVDRVLRSAVEVGAAVPALPCLDTVKWVAGGLVTGTLDRESIRLVQTPQAFRRDRLLEAYAKLGEQAQLCTDDAQIYQTLGLPIAWVEGEIANAKITRPEDLIAGNVPMEGVAPTSKDAATGQKTLTETSRCRIGLGYDVHPFGAGRQLVLAGVVFEGDGLTGDSDADIVSHAVTDAVLGAAGLGDLGRHFPPGDPRFTGARSLGLLSTAVSLASQTGYLVGNVDLTISARRPKIAPRALAMRENLAAAMGVLTEQVNVKATTGDGLGFVGREEGIAVHAVALLWRAA